MGQRFESSRDRQLKKSPTLCRAFFVASLEVEPRVRSLVSSFATAQKISLAQQDITKSLQTKTTGATVVFT